MSSTIRVHFANDPSLLPERFHVSEAQVAAALARYPDLRDAVEVSIDSLDGDMEQVREADVLVGWTFPDEMLAGARRLRWIHVIGAGVDHLYPFDWVPNGVVVTNSSGIHVDRAGDFIAGGLLMLNSHMPLHFNAQQEHRWSPAHSDPIAGKTVVIVGVGTIGGEGARRAKGLGLHVRGVRRTGEARPGIVDEMYAPPDLEVALRGADFVVVCAALTPNSKSLIGRRELELLPDRAGLINMARAAIVDYDALAATLRAGRLSGAILDVFDPEPLPSDSELWDCPRLVVTPHISSDPLDYTERWLEIFARNLSRFASDEPLSNQLRLDAGY